MRKIFIDSIAAAADAALEIETAGVYTYSFELI